MGLLGILLISKILTFKKVKVSVYENKKSVHNSDSKPLE
jgi:hypothetical protein